MPVTHRAAALMTLACTLAAFGGVQRERLADGWEFMRADGSATETNSAAWRAVRVPHDWGVEKSFDPAKPYGDAYLEPTGIGWYRRTFRLDPARAALIKSGGHLLFESNGMMSHSKVWVNGAYVGGWPYGYTAFRCDLTPHLKLDGENTLVVRCHNYVDSSRWYTGGGMYRECRFAFCPSDYLIPDSVAITTPEVTKARATVHVVPHPAGSATLERDVAPAWTSASLTTFAQAFVSVPASVVPYPSSSSRDEAFALNVKSAVAPSASIFMDTSVASVI